MMLLIFFESVVCGLNNSFIGILFKASFSLKRIYAPEHITI